MDRELRTEAMLAAGFVGAAAALVAGVGSDREFDVAVAVWLTALMVLMLRVEFDVSEGRTRPIVLVVVPMLVLLPAVAVPPLVALAQLLARVPEALAGRVDARRLVLVIADAWFVLAPAFVVALAGEPDPGGWDLLVYAGALAAQLALDFVVTAVRLRSVGIDALAERAVFAWVYLVDVLLFPVGLLAAVAGRRDIAWTAAVAPLAFLLVVFARERRGRLEAALALERERRESEERLQSILQSSSDLIVVQGQSGPARLVTGATGLVGDDHDDVLQGGLAARAHPDDGERVRALLHGIPAGATRRIEWRLRGAEGSYVEVESVVRNLSGDPRVEGVVVATRDVEARKAYEAQLRDRAFSDALTGLPNRALFYDRIQHALAIARRDGGVVAVGFLDLDAFKDVNDAHGHAGGDAVLQEVARRLRDGLRASDTAARLGGDEFGLLIEGASGPGEVAQVAERVLAGVSRAIMVDGVAIPVQASLGLAAATEDAAADDLLRRADVAMYAVKARGTGGWALYDPNLERTKEQAAGRDRRAWFAGTAEQREEIMTALTHPEAPRMVFQPILNVRTRELAGFEALARFDMIDQRPPDAWFDQARRCGLGSELETKALSMALQTPDRPPGTYITVNLSPTALADPRLESRLPERLDDVIIEVTEQELAGGNVAFHDALAMIRARGGRIAVDDAGAGYAGLKQLMEVGPDLIKLDRSLVDGVTEDPARSALIDSLVRFGKSIGAAVCAEGVEHVEDLERLSELDVAFAQGFGIARPAPPWPGVLPGTAVPT